MAGGMAGNEQYLPSEFADPNRIALVDAVSQAEDARLIAFVGVNFQRIFCEHSLVAAGMIAMMVSVQYCYRLEFFLFDPLQHRIGFGRIDDGALTGFLADD